MTIYYSTAREFKPPAGYHRRTFRIMCNELSVRHKVVDNDVLGERYLYVYIYSYIYINVYTDTYIQIHIHAYIYTFKYSKLKSMSLH
jgi:hypothetical protein